MNAANHPDDMNLVPRAERIARLNDAVRAGKGGKIVITQGVLRAVGRPEPILAALAAYDGFDSDNDPHGERDFGDLLVRRTACLFKIDSFSDEEMQFWSDDPADPSVTFRVATILLISEW